MISLCNECGDLLTADEVTDEDVLHCDAKSWAWW